jgi:cytochrome bd-type quinol oxidase subunit 2
MSIQLLSFMLVIALFSVYGWMSSIECGVALVRLLPKLSDNPKLSNDSFTPIWEVTNVFLVFGFTGFGILFNNGIIAVSKAVLSVIAVAMLALLTRAIVVLYLFYHSNIMGLHWLNGLFLITSFITPLGFGAAGIYLLTGQAFWQSQIGWVLGGSLLSGLLALSLAFVAWRNQTQIRNLRTLNLLANLLFVLTIFVLLRLIPDYLPHLLGVSIVAFAITVAGAAVIQTMFLIAKLEDYMWWILSPMALVLPTLLALANRPYLVFPSLTINQAYGAQAYGAAALIGLGVIFPVMLLGFWLLFKLLPSSKKPV